MTIRHVFAFVVMLALVPVAPLPAFARESLGVFGAWGTFRDPQVPRCYAIAAAEPSSRARDFEPFATIGTWPRANVRGQLYLRLSRRIAAGAPVSLRVGGDTFALVGNAGNAWAQRPAEDAAILTAIRSGARMVVSARDSAGNAFTDSYSLDGAATAMDAASVGCARRG